jgi:hypothetical protein
MRSFIAESLASASWRPSAGGGATRSDEGAAGLSIAGQRSISLRIFCLGSRRISLSTIARIFRRPPRAPSMASPARSGIASCESGEPQQPRKTSDIESWGRLSRMRFWPARKCSTPSVLPSPKRNNPLPDGGCRRHQSLSGFFMEAAPKTHADASENLIPATEAARNPGYDLSIFKLGRE